MKTARCLFTLPHHKHSEVQGLFLRLNGFDYVLPHNQKKPTPVQLIELHVFLNIFFASPTCRFSREKSNHLQEKSSHELCGMLGTHTLSYTHTHRYFHRLLHIIHPCKCPEFQNVDMAASLPSAKQTSVLGMQETQCSVYCVTAMLPIQWICSPF